MFSEWRKELYKQLKTSLANIPVSAHLFLYLTRALFSRHAWHNNIIINIIIIITLSRLTHLCKLDPQLVSNGFEIGSISVT